NWTQDGRLRAPVFLGLRNDVRAPEVSREVAGERAGELLPASAKEATLTIDGRTLKFTNIKKLYYPDDGITKRDVLNYYDAVADLILPHLADRPLSLKRYPNGIKEEYFFQKNTPDAYPTWLRTEWIDTDHSGAIRHLFFNDRAA